MNYNEIEILFAEDSIDDAALTLRALKKSGLTNPIYHVKDGAEALDFMYCKGQYVSRNISNHLKLILLDLKMPKVSGLQVLEKLKSNELTKGIPVVVLTSSKEDPDIEQCYRLGVSSYIVKPVDFDDFHKVVAELGMYWVLLNQTPR